MSRSCLVQLAFSREGITAGTDGATSGVAQARCWVLKDRATARTFSDESLRARPCYGGDESRGLRHEWTAFPPYDSCLQGLAATRDTGPPVA